MIAGFNSIEGGDFYFNDKRINDIDPARRNIGMVFQNYAIFPHMTVRDNVAFGLKNRKESKETIQAETDEFMELMHIKEYADRMPRPAFRRAAAARGAGPRAGHQARMCF